MDEGTCDCSAAEAKALSSRLAEAQAEVQRLRGELAAYESSQQEQAKLSQQLQQCSADAELSVLGAVTTTGSIAGDVIQHLLQHTTIDEKVVDAVSGHVGVAKDFTADVVGKLAAVDYNEYMKNITQHEIYLSHFKPAMGKVAEGAQPYVDLYVNPALETAKVYTDPALATAKETYANAAKTVEVHVFPLLWKHGRQVMTEIPRVWQLAQAYLHVALEPVFGHLTKAAPTKAKALPKGPIDRLLAICCLLLVSYYTVRVGAFLAKLLLWTAVRLALRLVWLAFRLAVRAPLLLVRRALSLVFWLLTGFYCCGLCRRRGSKAAKATAAPSNAKEEVKKAQKATVAELEKMLEGSKKSKKLEQAAKLLAGMAGSGKPMNNSAFPENVKGKLLDKDALKKALSKFKEVDQKKLGL